MKLSYLVTCSSETETLDRLLNRLTEVVRNTEDEVIVVSDIPPTKETLDIIEKHITKENMWLYSHPLNKDYGTHKNWGTQKCTKDFVFQIDGDELPSVGLMENVKLVIESNPNVELIYVPRINDFRGVTQEHAKQWGWKLTDMEFFRPCENKKVTSPIVNMPDFQGRIYKNEPTRIKWDRKLHEKIVGHKQYSFLPAEEEWALYHDKTIETQIKTNLRYNQVFTEADNKGHTVV